MKANAWFAHAIYSVEILVDYTAIQVYRRSRTRRGYAQSNYGRKVVDPGRNIFPADCGDRGWSDRQYHFSRGCRYTLRRRAGLSRRNARSGLFRRAFSRQRRRGCDGRNAGGPHGYWPVSRTPWGGIVPGDDDLSSRRYDPSLIVWTGEVNG